MSYTGARMRDRSEGSTLGSSPWYSVTPPEGPVYNYDYESLSSLHQDFMWDFVTPEYHRKSGEGQVFIKPMRRVTDRTVCPSGGLFEYDFDATTNYLGPGTASTTQLNATDVFKGGFLKNKPHSLKDVPDSELQECIAHAKQQALARMDATPFAFLEDLFEAKETVDFLRNPLQTARKLAKSFRKTRRTHLEKGKSIANATSSAWLEVRYAYRPIVMSILNAMEAYEERRSPRMKLRRKTNRRTARFADNFSDEGTVYYVRPDWTAVTTETRYKNRTNVRVGILYEEETAMDLLDPFVFHGLRLKDVSPTIWQVMPYTWVTDRFVDVASFIRGVQNIRDPNLTILGAWVSVEKQRSVSYKVTAAGTKTDYPVQAMRIHGEVCDRFQRDYERKPWQPTAFDALPTFRGIDKSSFSQIGDLAALTLQALTGNRRRDI